MPKIKENEKKKKKMQYLTKIHFINFFTFCIKCICKNISNSGKCTYIMIPKLFNLVIKQLLLGSRETMMTKMLNLSSKRSQSGSMYHHSEFWKQPLRGLWKKQVESGV